MSRVADCLKPYCHACSSFGARVQPRSRCPQPRQCVKLPARPLRRPALPSRRAPRAGLGPPDVWHHRRRQRRQTCALLPVQRPQGPVRLDGVRAGFHGWAAAALTSERGKAEQWLERGKTGQCPCVQAAAAWTAAPVWGTTPCPRVGLASLPAAVTGWPRTHLTLLHSTPPCCPAMQRPGGGPHQRRGLQPGRHAGGGGGQVLARRVVGGPGGRHRHRPRHPGPMGRHHAHTGVPGGGATALTNSPSGRLADAGGVGGGCTAPVLPASAAAVPAMSLLRRSRPRPPRPRRCSRWWVRLHPPSLWRARCA